MPYDKRTGEDINDLKKSYLYLTVSTTDSENSVISLTIRMKPPT